MYQKLRSKGVLSQLLNFFPAWFIRPAKHTFLWFFYWCCVVFPASQHQQQPGINLPTPEGWWSGRPKQTQSPVYGCPHHTTRTFCTASRCANHSATIAHNAVEKPYLLLKQNCQTCLLSRNPSCDNQSINRSIVGSSWSPLDLHRYSDALFWLIDENT